MKIIVLGGGPAGLYCSLLMKKAHPAHEITVIERNPPDATYGWGVVFSDRTLTAFREADYKTYKEITDHFVIWDAIDVHYRGELVRCEGHVYAGISRKLLLQILQRRCEELGVNMKFFTEVDDPSAFTDDYDLVIAADGVNSITRKTYAEVFRPTLDVHGSKYIWFGTHRVLDCFTFIFKENEHGLFTVHSYPFDGYTSTFIVECDEETWRRAGLDRASEEESIAYCNRLFAEELRGQSVLSNRSMWISFVTVKNKTWRHGHIVLLGDSAHTAHFSIGSGTKLAMEDAIALANAFEVHGEDIEAALADFEMERRPPVEAFQAAARESATYFEHVKRYADFEPEQFVFNLLTRSGRIDYDDLKLRDARLVSAVDRWFAGQVAEEVEAPPSVMVAPPPLFAPLRVRGMRLSNRVVISPMPRGEADEGMPDEGHVQQLVRLGMSGPGLVLTELTAVSADGRITPGCLGLYRPEQVKGWKRLVDLVHARSGAKVMVRLNHAGRRGATRPRSAGIDRPLREGGWPLLSASPIPYTPRSPVPKEMDRDDMDRVREAFVAAARWADEAGFDALELIMAHGYLLASFLSPLTNVRADEYGGALENRLRFPLEVLAAVRAVWPEEKPLVVALSVTDWVAGGFAVDEAVAVARALKEQGCDMVEVLAGQTVPEARPVYHRSFLASASDRVRNEAGIRTMVAGHIITSSQINTILAAGRADLCVVDELWLAGSRGDLQLILENDARRLLQERDPLTSETSVGGHV